MPILLLLAVLFHDPALDALVTEAKRNAPELTSARANAEAAQRRITPAGTLPDPNVLLTADSEKRGLMLEQMVPYPGKLATAGKAARSEAAEVETMLVGRAEKSVEARVRNAWYDLALALATDKILEDRRAAAAQIEESVRGRYAAGLAVQQDVLRAQIELARIDETKATQRAAILAARANLDALVGRHVDVTPALPEEVGTPEAPASNPELAATAQSVTTARLRVEQAEQGFLPDFVVRAGRSDMWEAGVGISLPVWKARKQRNQLAEARANVSARTADVETIRRDLGVRTAERLAQLEASQRAAVVYREKVLPLDELSLESALASYQAGKVPFLTVLDALNTLYGDRALYAARLAESAKWRVAVEEAM